MSEFDDLTGPAALGEDDVVADLSVVEEEEVDGIPVVDPVEEIDPLLVAEEEEEEDEEEDDAKETQDLMWDALYGDRE